MIHIKLVVAIVQDKDAGKAVEALTKASFRVTRLASSGGFLREGSTTLLVGVEESKVEEVTGVLETTCRCRNKLITPTALLHSGEGYYPLTPIEVEVGGATVFVLDVEQFLKI